MLFANIDILYMVKSKILVLPRTQVPKQKNLIFYVKLAQTNF